MAQHNVNHLPENPIQPLLLARDVSLEAGIQALVDVGQQIGYEVEVPKRSEVAMRGKATLGLSLTEPRRLQAALSGTYAQSEWGDLRESLSARWTDELIDLFFGADLTPEVDADIVQSRVFALLAFSSDGAGDLGARGLRFLWRAWNLRYQVLVRRRPLSLWPAIGGDVLGDVQSFTPVLTRIGETTWQVGWEGDARPESPFVFEAKDPAAALEQAWKVWVTWYQQETDAAGEQLRSQARQRFLSPPHLYHGVYEAALSEGGRLAVGDVSIENVSHAHLFSLHTARRGDLLLRTDRRTAAAVMRLACSQYDLELPVPEASAVAAGYLTMWAGQGVAFEGCEGMDIRPVSLPDDQVLAWKAVCDAGTASVAVFRQVAQLQRTPVIGLAVVGNQRAFLVPGRGTIALHLLERSGLGKKPLGQVDIGGVDLQDPAWKEALAAWSVYTSARRE